jgi:hypothetical protein
VTVAIKLKYVVYNLTDFTNKLIKAELLEAVPKLIPTFNPQGKYARQAFVTIAKRKKIAVTQVDIVMLRVSLTDMVRLRFAGFMIIGHIEDDVWEDARRADDQFWQTQGDDHWRKNGYAHHGAAFRNIIIEATQ